MTVNKSLQLGGKIWFENKDIYYVQINDTSVRNTINTVMARNLVFMSNVFQLMETKVAAL
jgi:ABC-type phosphate transport system ATPase subunit